MQQVGVRVVPMLKLVKIHKVSEGKIKPQLLKLERLGLVELLPSAAVLRFLIHLRKV